MKRVATLLVLASLVGCLGENRRPEERTRQPMRLQDQVLDPSRPALDESRLRDFGFAVYWDSFIRDEVVAGLYLEGDVDQGVGRPQLYAVTVSNRIYQVDLHSGMINWVFDVGEQIEFLDRDSPFAEWAYAPEKGTTVKPYDELYLIANDTLIALDKENGSELWRTRLGFGAASPPVAGTTHVYVGSWDDRIYAFAKDRPAFPAWNWRTDGDVIGRPVVESPHLYVPSADGKLYTFDSSGGQVQGSFNTEKRLVTDVLSYHKLLYLGAEDYNLYVLRADDGFLVERFGAGAPITSRPVAIGDLNGQSLQTTVLFSAQGEGIYALRRKPRPRGSRRGRIPHELLWKRPGAEQVLARGSTDVYLLEPGEASDSLRISRIDMEDGHFRDALELTGVDYVVTNPNSPHAAFPEESRVGGMIVIGFKNGWVMALKELATMPSGSEQAPLPQGRRGGAK